MQVPETLRAWLGQGGDLADRNLEVAGDARAVLRVERVGDGSDPRHLVVEQIPEQAEPPTGAEHADDLAERRVLLEPVEGLPDDDRVDALVRERDRLSGAVEGLGRGRDQGAHRLEGLDRDDLMAEREQRGRQLSRAGPEVQDALRAVADAELDRLARIRGPPELVRLGLGAEGGGAPGGLVVH